jgi:hypothetical protein
MVDIITDLPKDFTTGELDQAFVNEIELDQAFVNEIKSGFKLEKETEHLRVQQARKEAQEEKGKTHPVLGKCVATMPAREFFRLTGKYGHDEIHSKKFLKYYQRNFGDLSPNKI